MLSITQKLERIKNHRTRYELVASKGQETILIVYSSSRSRGTIYRACINHGPALKAITGTDSIVFAKTSRAGATMGDWKIRFERTQHDAIVLGEHQFIGEISPVLA